MTTSGIAIASLCGAALFGDLDAIRAHLDDGTDVNGTTTNATGEALTPLMWASAGGQVDAIHLLTAWGASATHVDPVTGWTALHSAARADQPEAVAVLLALGADRDAPADHDHGREVVKPIDLAQPGTATFALLLNR